MQEVSFPSTVENGAILGTLRSSGRREPKRFDKIQVTPVVPGTDSSGKSRGEGNVVSCSIEKKAAGGKQVGYRGDRKNAGKLDRTEQGKNARERDFQKKREQ